MVRRGIHHNLLFMLHVNRRRIQRKAAFSKKEKYDVVEESRARQFFSLHSQIHYEEEFFGIEVNEKWMEKLFRRPMKVRSVSKNEIK